MDSNRDIVSSSSSWDGRLTHDGFAIAARAFADNWTRHNKFHPPWSWIPLRNRTLEEGYLSLEKICVFTSLQSGSMEDDPNSPNAASNCLDKDNSMDPDPNSDPAMLVQTQLDEEHYYDFHIIYTASYAVPVLYFRGYCCDGQPLSLTAIEKDMPICSKNLMLESKWTFITQEEHPYLNRPWFKLHPCGTREWIKLLFDCKSSTKCHIPVESYLVSWFSVVGKVVGLKIPLEMMNYRPFKP